MLTSGFAETDAKSSDTIKQCSEDGEYDYESDSDLDEFEVDSMPSSSAGSSRAKGKSKVDDDGTPSALPRDHEESKSQIHHILLPNIAHRTYVL